MNTYDEMNNVLNYQKEFFIKNGAPSIDLRIDRLQRLKSLIMDNRYDFVDALNADFGNRSKNASMLSDVYGIMPAINLAIKKCKKSGIRLKRNRQISLLVYWVQNHILNMNLLELLA